MKMDQIGRSIFIKLTECILQSRVNVEKKQIRHFDQINKQINKRKETAYEANLHTFLAALLIVDKYNLKQKIDLASNYQSATILFKLVHKSTGIVTDAEFWSIQFQQYRPIQQQHEQQQFQIITTLFQQLLFFLNKQPLFSEYQRNLPMKNSYILDYELKLKDANKKVNQTYKSPTILQLSHKYTKERVCRSFLIKIQCYYLPKFDNLLQNLEKSSKMYGIKGKKQQQTMDTSKNARASDSSDNDKSRKTSIYEYYDKQLDFVFLASDDETFKNSPKNKIKQMDISFVDDNDQFELLMVSKDDEFLDDNKTIFKELSSYQKTYFHN